MKTRYLATPLLLVSLLWGCTNEFDEVVDCSDECIGGCDVVAGFDYQYQGSCTSAEEQEFCGPFSDADPASCVEPEFEIEEVTVARIHQALQEGEISCEWLTGRYIERVLWHDLRMTGTAPPLNAFVTLNEQALETARALDDFQRCEGRLAGPLHCAPFVIKTNYASTEVPVTNGSHALREARPNFNAFVVERLRRGGAITLGSTTMDEFARGAHSISGRSGRTGNAYNTRYNPGGSSSGSAVAVSANFAVAGLGTDNCSSLTVPAAFNGLTTLRSSHRLVSTAGIFPSNQLDAVAGPMTRTVEDLALFFDSMVDFNPRDRNHCSQTMPREESYASALDAQGLEGKRIGILRSMPQDDRFPFEGGNQEIQDHYLEFFEELRGLGAEVIDEIELPGLPLERSSSGMGQEVNRFLANTSGGVADVDELCDTELYSFSTFESKRDCERFNSRSDRNLASRIESGMEEYESNRSYVESVLDELNLDALVYPVDGGGAPRITGLRSNCILASVTGLPTIVVPTGFTNAGLPVGMSFTGRMFEESTLFEIAYGYEQGTMHRRPPVMQSVEGELPLNIEEFNRIHLEIGERAFDEVLREQSRFDLTHSLFTELVREVLQANELGDLLPNN